MEKVREDLLSWCLDLALKVLTALFLGFATWAITKAAAWYQDLSKTKVTSEWVQKAVAWTDEQARKFQKGLISTGPVTAQQKLAYAKQYLKDLAPAAVNALKDIDLERAIEAGVNLLRRQAPPPETTTTPAGV